MYFTVDGHQISANKNLIDQMYRLRAQVFKNELGWDVEVHDGREIDKYDDLKPVYLMWTNPSRNLLLGSLRLLPTTGPTLLHDVFRRTFPSDMELSAPGIWEGTRLCINQTAIADEHPEMDMKTAFCRMLLALCEVGVENGISTLVSNFEPPTKRLYQMAGAPLNFLGKADGYGKRPVCAGTFQANRDTLHAMRAKLNVTQRLIEPKERYFAEKSISQIAA